MNLDISRYRSKRKRGVKRTDKQRDQDFESISILLSEGLTWSEITSHLNEENPYYLSAQTYKRHYTDALKVASLRLSPDQEIARLVEDLDAIMKKAIDAWNLSLKGYEQTEEVFERLDELDPNTPEIAMQLSKKVVKSYKGQGNAKYLEVYLKAHERKTDLVLPKETAPILIQQIINRIDMAGEAKTLPATSEKDLLDEAENIDFSAYEDITSSNEAE